MCCLLVPDWSDVYSALLYYSGTDDLRRQTYPECEWIFGAIMTNDINFNAKSKTNPSIMEPIDETPSLTLKVNICELKLTIYKYINIKCTHTRAEWGVGCACGFYFSFVFVQHFGVVVMRFFYLIREHRRLSNMFYIFLRIFDFCVFICERV